MPSAPAVIRIAPPRTAFGAALLGAICLLPVAALRPWLAVLFLIPVGAAGWVARAGVDVGPAGITVRALAGQRSWRWDELAALRVGRRGELFAVLASGALVRLPCARARHLPVITAASGGRLDQLGTG